jgi:hypothetical protein
MNYKLLHWMEEILHIFRLQLKCPNRTMLVTPQIFMKYLADGIMLVRLARILGGNKILPDLMDKKKCYEYFYKFAKEKAKLAEGCVSYF